MATLVSRIEAHVLAYAADVQRQGDLIASMGDAAMDKMQAMMGQVAAQRDIALALAAERERLRDDRQKQVSDWCVAAFGLDHATSVPQRAVRLLEEAIEAYQAAGADPGMAHKLIDFVFSRLAGNLTQELGGIGLTLLALAAATGASADAEEAREFARVLAKPLAYFTARNKTKNAAGFEVGYCASPAQDEGKPTI